MHAAGSFVTNITLQSGDRYSTNTNTTSSAIIGALGASCSDGTDLEEVVVPDSASYDLVLGEEYTVASDQGAPVNATGPTLEWKLFAGQNLSEPSPNGLRVIWGQ